MGSTTVDALNAALLCDTRACSSVSADAVVSSQRWEQLGIYFCLTIASQISWIMYSSVPRLTSEAFDATAAQVTFISTLYPLLFLPGCFLAARATKRGGLRGCIVESAGWMVCGAFVKAAASALGWACRAPGAAFAGVGLGQAMMALGQPHLVNSPAQLAQEWFPPTERETAATLGLLGNIVGQAAGEALSPALVEWVDSFSNAAASMTALAVVALVPCIGGGAWAASRFVASPNAPKVKNTTLLGDWRSVLRDRHFAVLFVAFCLGLGVFNALLALVAQWLQPCHYSAGTSGGLGATFVSVGVPAAAAIALALDATRRYKSAVKFVAAMDLVSTVLVACAARRNDAPLLYVAFGALGGSIVATSAVVMETAVECTYPISPEVSTGALFCGGNILSIISTYAFQWLLELQHGGCEPLTRVFVRPHAPVALFLVINVFLCSILLFCYDGPYRRLEAEQIHERRRSQDTQASASYYENYDLVDAPHERAAADEPAAELEATAS